MNTTAFCYRSGQIRFGRRVPEGLWYLIDVFSHGSPVEVSHWAPLPPLPAGLQEVA